MAALELTGLSLEEFLDRLASGAPTPGGGAAAALTGALAAALVSMACNLTLGRDKFADVEPQIRGVLERSEELRAYLRSGVPADAAAFEAVMAAYRLPRGSEAEQARRSAAIQEATREAALPPLEVAERCASVLSLADELVPICNPNGVSDVAVAALLAGTAIEEAAANVEINLRSIDDERFVTDLRQRLAPLRLGRQERVEEVVRAADARSGS